MIAFGFYITRFESQSHIVSISWFGFELIIDAEQIFLNWNWEVIMHSPLNHASHSFAGCKDLLLFAIQVQLLHCRICSMSSIEEHSCAALQCGIVTIGKSTFMTCTHSLTEWSAMHQQSPQHTALSSSRLFSHYLTCIHENVSLQQAALFKRPAGRTFSSIALSLCCNTTNSDKSVICLFTKVSSWIPSFLARNLFKFSSKCFHFKINHL